MKRYSDSFNKAEPSRFADWKAAINIVPIMYPSLEKRDEFVSMRVLILTSESDDQLARRICHANVPSP